jgi:hypothetical protein
MDSFAVVFIKFLGVKARRREAKHPRNSTTAIPDLRVEGVGKGV